MRKSSRSRERPGGRSRGVVADGRTVGMVPGSLENSELLEPNIVLVADKPTGASWLMLRYLVSAPGALFDTKAPSPLGGGVIGAPNGLADGIVPRAP